MNKQKTFYDYEGFVAKFQPKKTTDDCYTPPYIYETVKNYVNDHVTPLSGVPIVRPFRPGGDYEGEGYPPGCLVLDNPPFSILARIVRFYATRHIRYFLFAPSLTAFGLHAADPQATIIVAAANITYENGAIVNTSFVTNVFPGHPAFTVAGTLFKLIEQSSKDNKVDKSRPPSQIPFHGRLRRPPQ